MKGSLRNGFAHLGKHLLTGSTDLQTRRPTLLGKLGSLLSSCILIGITYAALYLSVGQPFYYGGPAWSTMLIWVAAQGAGWLFGMIRLPPLLGMLLVGLTLKNAAPSSVAGLPSSWSTFLRTAALSIIFLRSGLELDLKVFSRVGGAAVRLLLIPGLTEAAVLGVLAVPLLGLPLLWGFTLGFILKAVGPAIIITTMYELQKQRLGVTKGVPSIIMAAASFDDMVAITGYGLCSNFAFSHTGKSLAWQIAHGPLEIVLGSVGGILGGMFCSSTLMWRSRYQRTIAALMTAVTLTFAFYKYEMRSAGPLAALVTGMALKVCCDKGWPPRMSVGPNLDHPHQVERDLGALWRWVAQPLLFGIIGTLVNLRTLKSPSIIPRALALILTGLAVRIPMSFLAVSGAGLTLYERMFVAIAWTPKATVQAALGPLPLDTILAKEGPDSPNIQHAEAILTASVLAILVCGTVGVMGIHFTAPKWLAQGSDPSPGSPEWKLWKETQAQQQAGTGRSTPRGSLEDGVSVEMEEVASLPGLRAASSCRPTQPITSPFADHAGGIAADHYRTLSEDSYTAWRAALGDALSATASSLAGLLSLGPGLPISPPRHQVQTALSSGLDGQVDVQVQGSAGGAVTQGMVSSPSAPALMQSAAVIPSQRHSLHCVQSGGLDDAEHCWDTTPPASQRQQAETAVPGAGAGLVAAEAHQHIRCNTDEAQLQLHTPDKLNTHRT